MRRDQLAALVRTLGREFVARGMSTHARKLRLYYLALRHGLTESRGHVDLQWSEDCVTEWLRVLNLEPFQGAYPHLQAGDPCPKCPAIAPLQPGQGHSAPRAAVRTILVFPNGAKMECVRCGHAWVTHAGPSST